MTTAAVRGVGGDNHEGDSPQSSCRRRALPPRRRRGGVAASSGGRQQVELRLLDNDEGAAVGRGRVKRKEKLKGDVMTVLRETENRRLRCNYYSDEDKWNQKLSSLSLMEYSASQPSSASAATNSDDGKSERFGSRLTTARSEISSTASNSTTGNRLNTSSSSLSAKASVDSTDDPSTDDPNCNMQHLTQLLEFGLSRRRRRRVQSLAELTDDDEDDDEEPEGNVIASSAGCSRGFGGSDRRHRRSVVVESSSQQCTARNASFTGGSPSSSSPSSSADAYGMHDHLRPSSSLFSVSGAADHNVSVFKHRHRTTSISRHDSRGRLPAHCTAPVNRRSLLQSDRICSSSDEQPSDENAIMMRHHQMPPVSSRRREPTQSDCRLQALEDWTSIRQDQGSRSRMMMQTIAVVEHAQPPPLDMDYVDVEEEVDVHHDVDDGGYYQRGRGNEAGPRRRTAHPAPNALHERGEYGDGHSSGEDFGRGAAGGMSPYGIPPGYWGKDFGRSAYTPVGGRDRNDELHVGNANAVGGGAIGGKQLQDGIVVTEHGIFYSPQNAAAKGHHSSFHPNDFHHGGGIGGGGYGSIDPLPRRPLSTAAPPPASPSGVSPTVKKKGRLSTLLRALKGGGAAAGVEADGMTGSAIHGGRGKKSKALKSGTGGTGDEFGSRGGGGSLEPHSGHYGGGPPGASYYNSSYSHYRGGDATSGYYGGGGGADGVGMELDYDAEWIPPQVFEGAAASGAGFIPKPRRRAVETEDDGAGGGAASALFPPAVTAGDSADPVTASSGAMGAGGDGGDGADGTKEEEKREAKAGGGWCGWRCGGGAGDDGEVVIVVDEATATTTTKNVDEGDGGMTERTAVAAAVALPPTVTSPEVREKEIAERAYRLGFEAGMSRTRSNTTKNVSTTASSGKVSNKGVSYQSVSKETNGGAASGPDDGGVQCPGLTHAGEDGAAKNVISTNATVEKRGASDDAEVVTEGVDHEKGNDLKGTSEKRGSTAVVASAGLFGKCCAPSSRQSFDDLTVAAPPAIADSGEVADSDVLAAKTTADDGGLAGDDTARTATSGGVHQSTTASRTTPLGEVCLSGTGSGGSGEIVDAVLFRQHESGQLAPSLNRAAIERLTATPMMMAGLDEVSSAGRGGDSDADALSVGGGGSHRPLNSPGGGPSVLGQLTRLPSTRRPPMPTGASSLQKVGTYRSRRVMLPEVKDGEEGGGRRSYQDLHGGAVRGAESQTSLASGKRTTSRFSGGPSFTRARMQSRGPASAFES